MTNTRRKPKKIRYYCYSIDPGKYLVTWCEKAADGSLLINEMVVTDKDVIESFKRSRNPYKSGAFPYVPIDYKRSKPVRRRKK